MSYLLDTNIIVFWIKGRYQIAEKINSVGLSNCLISEVSVAELKFGVECSPGDLIQAKRTRLENLLSRLEIIPFAVAINIYAQEKARLKLAGEIIPDFDLLIGATAIACEMTMVSNNSKHLSRMQGIEIEDWTIR
jgi:tRNA(fMet)-specific endonuclease VapC